MLQFRHVLTYSSKVVLNRLQVLTNTTNRLHPGLPSKCLVSRDPSCKAFSPYRPISHPSLKRNAHRSISTFKRSFHASIRNEEPRTKKENLAKSPTNDQKATLLIDASPFIFRSFHAVPVLGNGIPLNAVYGFIRTLLKIMKENPHTNLIVCMDGDQSFRKAMNPEYKANRKPVAPELVSQFPIITEALNAFGIASVRISGFEADDVIATYTKLARMENHQVVIISPDKDMLQLVGEGVAVKSLTDTYSSGIHVKSKFGVLPEQFPHYQALVGDAADNIPKANGIGTVTAKNLMNAFGSIHNMFDRLSEIKNTGDRKKIEASKDSILLSLTMATLRSDVPVPPLSDGTFNGLKKESSFAFCSKYRLASISASLKKDWFTDSPPMETSSAIITAKKVKRTKATKVTDLEAAEQELIESHFRTISEAQADPSLIPDPLPPPKAKRMYTRKAKTEPSIAEGQLLFPPPQDRLLGTTGKTRLTKVLHSIPLENIDWENHGSEDIAHLEGTFKVASESVASMEAPALDQIVTAPLEESGVAKTKRKYTKRNGTNLDTNSITIEGLESSELHPRPDSSGVSVLTTSKASSSTKSSAANDFVRDPKSTPVPASPAPNNGPLPPTPRARRRRSPSAEPLSTEGHVSIEVDIDTDTAVQESTQQYKEAKKKRTKATTSEIPSESESQEITSAPKKRKRTNSSEEKEQIELLMTQSDLKESSSLDKPLPKTRRANSLIAQTTEPEVALTEHSSLDSIQAKPKARKVKSDGNTDSAPPADVSEPLSNSKSRKKASMETAAASFFEALKATAPNPAALEEALNGLKHPVSDDPVVLVIDTGAPKPKTRHSKKAIDTKEDGISGYPATKKQLFGNMVEVEGSPVTPSSNRQDVASATKEPKRKEYSIFRSAPGEGAEENEDDEESNLELVDFIKNRSVEVDVEFINLFEHCSTNKQRREVIESRIKGVTVANDQESAAKILSILMQLKDRFHACDTEVIDVDLKKEGPVGKGRIICASIYAGPDIDFGNGPRVWIDCLDDESTLLTFKEYFESKDHLKVWHNYGFDRHVLFNHGINASGFGGDTMHMARLWDSSRRGAKAYSLEVLSRDLLLGDSKASENVKAKTSMKQRFGQLKLKKDGTPSKTSVIIPELDSIQRDARWLPEWIDYSTLDAEDTWRIREVLASKLTAMTWTEAGKDTMMDFYKQMWLPFGELLTDMERRGIKVDKEYLSKLVPSAMEEKQQKEQQLVEWAIKFVGPECRFMNPGSDAQKQQLLFAPCVNQRDSSKEMPASREFLAENTEGFIEEGKKAPKKKRSFTITGIGLPFTDATESGWPSVSHPVLAKLVGDPPEQYGPLLQMFEKKKLLGGKEACEALAAAVEASKIDTLIGTFMLPLGERCDEHSRIHGSLNINTETGRLSSRRPNLQNQPAHEKDKFKIRKAFTCEPGNRLIVADYGQLELRLLAHMTNCRSMIDAFRSGGDFHSRTALGMYSHVKQAIDDGKALLEWDSSKGKAPLPLLKDAFGTERRRAKTLNFSIAYGKTVMGLAKDWNVSTEEAKDTLDKWYSDRPEVKIWQEKTIARARVTGWTRTLLGRYRPLPDIRSVDKVKRGHSERAAINTPLQGGAADITTCAMNLLYKHPRLNQLNWHQLLQIHDELILEGPEESVEEAMDIVVKTMANPLPYPLLVDLVVDAKSAKTWYEAK